jgi:glycosyltransferase involved in cell wall biosynthesis
LLFLHPSDELYGADRMLLEMLASVPAGVEVEVWVPNDLAHPPDGQSLCQELTRRGMKVRHVGLPILRRAYGTPRGAADLLARSGKLVRALRQARPSAVYCTTSAAFLCAPLARLAGVRRVIGHVQEIWSGTDAVVLTGPARACDTLLCISDAVAASLPSTLRRRTVVVPNGTVEPVGVTAVAERTGPLRFLVASRWNGWKGHGTLLEAWNRASDPGHLTVLGGKPLSGESVDVVALVAGLDDPSSVSVVGEVADSSQAYEDADVVVVPSDQPEPFGLIAIEAFARGRPVIASAAGGLTDIVTDGRDGWLFPPRDSTALGALLSSLTRDDVQAAALVARQTFRERFTAERFAENWRQAVFAGCVW